MATWWITKGWPWTKKNWWAVLLAPLALLVVISMIAAKLMNRGPAVNPLAPADERAAVEAETRARQLEAERDRLASELAEIQAEHESLRAHFESRLHDEVQSLRDDPERLRQLMLSTGRGS